MKRLVSRPSGLARLDAHTSDFPSGLNIGKPSKAGAVVIRSGSPDPSLLMTKMSNSRPRESSMFDEKMTWLPSGVKKGQKFAELLLVICFAPEPSAFAVQSSIFDG